MLCFLFAMLEFLISSWQAVSLGCAAAVPKVRYLQGFGGAEDHHARDPQQAWAPDICAAWQIFLPPLATCTAVVEVAAHTASQAAELLSDRADL
eukprot:SAG11_NODE_21228_length_429_cov_0.942424_1_plen_93_part_01